MIFRRIISLLVVWILCFASLVKDLQAQTMYPMNISHMYSLASDGNVRALRYAVQRGLNINAIDRNGNTGICHAILQRNYTAYNTFRAAGADGRHPCVSRIPKRNYDSFMSSRQVTPLGEIPHEVYKGFEEGEYSFTKGQWLLGGAVVAGAAVAIAIASSSGGGSKKHSSPDPVDYDEINKNAGERVGTATPDKKGADYVAPTVDKNTTSGSTMNKVKDYSIKNDSSVKNSSGELERLTSLVNFNDSVTEYAKYLSVAMKATNGATVTYGTNDGYNSPNNKYMTLGSNTVGMAADGEGSKAANFDQINVKAQNGTIGMLGSEEAEIYNFDRILLSMISANDANSSVDDVNTKNQVIGMYVDTSSTAVNYGTIDGINNINGTLIGMESRLINQEIDPDALDPNTLINNHIIDLGLTAENATRTSTVIGMGTVYDKEFLDGTKRFVRAIDTDIVNNGNIYLTLNLGTGGSYVGDVTTGNEGVIGMLAGANTIAINADTAAIRVFTVDNETQASAMAAMLAVHGGTAVNQGYIWSQGGLESYGMLGVRGPGTNSEINFFAPTLINDGTINMDTINATGMASLYGGAGIYDEPGNVVNTGVININKGGIGMKMQGYGTATNQGIINLVDDLGQDTSAGMYASDGGQIINDTDGIINITDRSNSGNVSAMYATGVGSKIINRGTINVNYTPTTNDLGEQAPVRLSKDGGYWLEEADWEDTGETDEDDNPIYEWVYNGRAVASYLAAYNGAIFSNSGGTYNSNTALNLNLLAVNGGMVEIGRMGTFIAPTIEGTVYAASDIVTDGFKKEYVNERSFVGEDVGINLLSNSALYNAELRDNEDGESKDVVMTADFGVVRNKEVASLLSLNNDELIEIYDNGGTEDSNRTMLMTGYKQFADANSLNGAILNTLGLDTIPNFAKQNLDVIKSLDAQINNSLLSKDLDKDARFVMGYDYYNRDQDGTSDLSGYKDQANSVYGFADTKAGSNMRYGFGMSATYYDSDYDNDASRHETIIQAFAPLTFMFEDMKLVSAPRIGYGFGEYTRKAGGQSYDADTENYYYGITNELRKTFDLGAFELEPVAEFNVLGLYQNATKEDNGIDVSSSNNLSIEGGLGLYAKKDFNLGNADVLTLRLGGTYYHELNNPYQASSARMSGMSGSYHMESYDTQRDRGVVSIQLAYQKDMLDFYVMINQYLEDHNAFGFNLGAAYRF